MALERLAGAELGEWVPERALRTPPIVKVRDPKPERDGDSSPLVPLIPDGEFTLRLSDGRSQSFRVEIDMATIAHKRLGQRLRAYLAHSRKDVRPVLWVVPHAPRGKQVLEWATAEARTLSADPTLFWVTTQDLISPELILRPIWRVVGGPMAGLVPEELATASNASPRPAPQPVVVSQEATRWTL
jgi:hypothetical protein